MKICAVICEYDPFHLGHEYQIKRLKDDGYSVVAIMSGSFTQRGSAAVISKYSRARAAVCSGADLVLELPFPYCSGGASKFAGGAVALAERLGCVDTLAFGSECGNTDEIITAAKNMLSPELERKVAERTGGGERYAEAFSSVYNEMYGKSDVLYGSNDLLAVEYIKTILRLDSRIKPYAIKRMGQNFNDTAGKGFASASSVRDMIKNRKFGELNSAVTEESARLIREAAESGAISLTERLFLPYASYLRTRAPYELENIAEMNGELASRICASARNAGDLNGLIGLAKTKIYSESRVRRAMLFSMLGVKNEDFSEPMFSVLLGANAAGRAILSVTEKTSSVPIITKPADYRRYGEKVIAPFELLLSAEALWTLTLKEPRDAGYLMRCSPYISEE